MKYRVVHVTSYRYDEPVALSHNAARLAPRNSALQLVGRCVVEVSPAPAVMHRYVDYFGNTVDSFALQVPHVALTITATTEVEVLPRSPISTADAARAPAWETLAAQDAWLPIDVAEHRFESPMVPTSPDLARFARESFHPGRPVLDAALALNHAPARPAGPLRQRLFGDAPARRAATARGRGRIACLGPSLLRC